VVHAGLGSRAACTGASRFTGPGPAGKAGKAEGGEMPLVLVLKDKESWKEEAEETTLALNRIANTWFRQIFSCLWNSGLERRGKGFVHQEFADQ